MSAKDKTKITTRVDARDEAPEIIENSHGEIICFSDRSPKKETPNEDALAVIPIDDKSTVLVVADGMGGMPAGEQASKMVIDSLIETLGKNKGPLRDAILNGIEDANGLILDIKAGAGTTVAVVEINQNVIRTYHAGDSLIMLTTNHGNIKHQSLAHSPISYALACGAINKEQAMRHPERNLISNYVGCHDMHITIGPQIELGPLDTLVLSSDALPDNLYEEEICELIRKGPLIDGVKSLISDCKRNMIESFDDRRCHPDDFSMICFRLSS